METQEYSVQAWVLAPLPSPLPLNDLKDSLRKYTEARRRSSSSSEVLDSEAERLYSSFREYVSLGKMKVFGGFLGYYPISILKRLDWIMVSMIGVLRVLLLEDLGC